MAPKSSRYSISARHARRRRSAKLAGLQCEQLEDRTTPALFNVQNSLSFSGLSNNGCVATADFNKDGFMDAVLTNMGTGYGEVDPVTGLPTVPGTTITVLYGKAGGGFNRVQLNTNGENVTFASIADINGDTWPDVVVSNANRQNTGSVSVFQNDGAGNLSLGGRTPFSTFSNNPDWVGLADVTGDGILDAIVSSIGKTVGSEDVTGNNVTIFQGNADAQGKGNFTFSGAPITTLAPGIQFIPTALAVADFDGDGLIDIAAAVPGTPPTSSDPQVSGSVYVFKGTGSGGFAAPNQFDTGGALPINIQAADLNGDNKQDLIVANAGDPRAPTEFTDNSVGVILNVSSVGNLNFGVTNSLTANCHGTFAVAIADFDLDGKKDIAAVNYGALAAFSPTAFVSLYMGSGTGTFNPGSPGTYNADANAATAFPGGQYLAVGDFNSDGVPDLIVAQANNRVGLLFNTSTAQNSASSFTVSGPSSTTAGVAQSYTVTAKNTSGNTVTSYTGTIHFTSNDSQAGLPADYTFTAADNGVHTFTITLKTAGSRSLTATDTVTSSITGTQSAITVTAAAASTFTVSAPSTTLAGTAFNTVVTAKDAFGNTATGYTGTIHFTSSDAQAVLPADYTFVAADNGAHTFTTITLKTAGNQSVTATDTVTSSITGTATTSVRAAAPSVFTVAGFPTSTTAGVSQSFTVTAKDAFGNTVTYTGTVHFTSSDGQAALPADYTFVSADSGVHTFTATLKTAGTQSLTVTDTVTSSITGTQSGITVTAAAASAFQVSMPATAIAGTAFNTSVAAKDAFGNTVTGYTGTIHLTSSDAQAVLPADYTFVSADNGTHIFTTVTLKTAGSQSVTATDTVSSSINGSATTTVNAAAAATLAMTGFPSSVTAGTAQNFTVTAKDAFGNTASGYTGTVHFTSSDGQASLPADYTFVAADSGAHTFTATLKTAGTQSLTATDTATASITGSVTTTVNAAASAFTVAGFPATTTAGVSQTFTVTATDVFGNTVTGYTGTVHFTSSDGQAVLPANYTFIASDAGIHTFTATLKTAGTQSLTATDTTTSSITGTQSGIIVTAAAASTFTVSMPSSVTAGTAFNASVTAKDAFGNIATGYTGTAHFTSTDGQATLPSNYAFVAADNGTHTFTVTFKTAGSQSLTATDTVTSSITGTATTTVGAAAASTFTVSMPSSATAGTAVNASVTAKDAFGNTATGYTGTAHFTSTDGQATLPSNYTFVAADSGTHTFTVTFKTAGTQSLTATDIVTASITGSATTTVGAAATHHFSVSAPATATAGIAFSVTVTALDAFNNVATNYFGSVQFTSSDGQATLPPNYTFNAADGGVRTFTSGVILRTAGNQTVIATDTATSSITGSATTTVGAAAASTFTVSMPSSVTAGTAFNASVTAKDAFGNTATGYTGTAHFTSTDGQATLPSNYAFVAADSGTHTFTVTFKTAGSQSLTATDTVTSSITGTATTTVGAAAASTFTVSMPSSATAGTAFNASVTAKDAFGNTATGYTGTAHFTSTDGQATLPSNYTFVAADSGTHTFTVTFKTAGSQSLTATDIVTSSITGTATTTVGAAAASTFTVSMPSSVTAGTAFNASVTAKDAFGNIATGYTGTAHFTSTDGQATLPSNYAFVAADNGTHTFTVTFKTAGSQSLTATDTVTSSITGTATTTVGAAAASTFTVSMPSSATAGTAVNASVTAKDAFGNTATGYTGTAHFTSTDGQATLPSNYTFVAADSGTHTFTVTFKTAGTQSLTATDIVTASITGSATTTVDGSQPFAVGNTPGTLPIVTMYNPDHTVRFTAQPFGSTYTKGIRIAVGDVTGDGIADVVAATNGGIKAKAKIIDGATGLVLPTQLFGITSYTGPVSVAVGDVDGDGVADIAIGTSQNGARARVFHGGDFALLKGLHTGTTFGFVGRTSVALADMTGDGKADLVVSSLYTTGSRVVGFDGTTLAPGVTPVKAFNAFMLGGGYVSGLFLALGDVNGDGRADLVIGSAATRNPNVTVFSGRSLVDNNIRTKIASFAPGGSSKNGVRVAVRDIDGDGKQDLLTSSGELVSAFQGGSSLPATGLPQLLFAFDPNIDVNGGVWVG